MIILMSFFNGFLFTKVNTKTKKDIQLSHEFRSMFHRKKKQHGWV